MAEKKQTVAASVASLVKNAVEECGCDLWDVTYGKQDGENTLTIYIDKPDGISLTDCEMVNDAVNPLLDEADPIAESYCLEISSPGLERELKTPEHLRAFLGEKVTVKLYKALDGHKTYVGTLAAYDEEADSVTLESEGASRTFERAACAVIRTVFDF